MGRFEEELSSVKDEIQLLEKEVREYRQMVLERNRRDKCAWVEKCYFGVFMTWFILGFSYVYMAEKYKFHGNLYLP